jgi:hypothetical protein
MDMSEFSRRGGRARWQGLSAEERSEAAREAQVARWARVRSRACPGCGLPLGAGKLHRTDLGAFTHPECAPKIDAPP